MRDSDSHLHIYLVTGAQLQYLFRDWGGADAGHGRHLLNSLERSGMVMLKR